MVLPCHLLYSTSMKTLVHLNAPLDAVGDRGQEVEEGEQIQKDGVIPEEHMHAARPDMNVQDGGPCYPSS